MIEIGTKDSDATKRALLPARIKYWREQGQEALADRLQAEYDAAKPTMESVPHETTGSDLGEGGV